MNNKSEAFRRTPRMKRLARELLCLTASATLLYLAPVTGSFVDNPLLQVGTAVAQEEGRRPPPTARSSETLTRRVYERIEEVMTLREAENYTEARVIMDEIKAMYDRDQLNDREKYTMWLFYASLDQAEENYQGAVDNYRQILALPNLTPEQIEQTWFYIGSLHFALEQYREAIDAFNSYNEVALQPNDDVYLRIASAYYALEEYQNALPNVLKNMELARAAGKEIPQTTYGLLRALYLTLEDFQNARQILREMVVLFNDPQDWALLAAIEGQLENFTVQGHTYFVANAAGYLENEGQFLNLASQLYNNDNPFGCARIIEKGMDDGIIEEDEDNLSFLGTCWQLAREDAKAAPVLERAAALSDDGELFVRLGRVYMTLSEWEKSIDAFNSGLEKGVDREDQVYLSLARSYMELNRYDEGIQAARNAGRDERSADTSRTWVQVLTSEKQRYDTLQRQRRELAQFFRN